MNMSVLNLYCLHIKKYSDVHNINKLNLKTILYDITNKSKICNFLKYFYNQKKKARFKKKKYLYNFFRLCGAKHIQLY